MTRKSTKTHFLTKCVHWDKQGYTAYSTVCNDAGQSRIKDVDNVETTEEVNEVTCKLCYDNINDRILFEEGFDPYAKFEDFRKEAQKEKNIRSVRQR